MTGQPDRHAISLGTPADLSGHRAPSRLVFGPHETNLGDGRRLSSRHVAYYARRAAAGVGVIVTETASVEPDDWPYERAPLASECGPGWRAVADACASHGTLVLAGLGHAGAQGSSAYSQAVMWAPSPVADVVSREMPAEMDAERISEVVAAFASAAALAVASGLAGVEVDAGAWSLLRQFHSGLTNLRGDSYGADRLRFTREVLAAVRRSVGPDALVALRLSGDELAPWAGITPDAAETMVADLAGPLDLITVVRGGPYSTGAYRPDAHTPTGFNRPLCARLRAAAGGVPVVLQGSVVDPAEAEAALAAGECDLVEMTRALIADADLLARHRAGRRPRPCVLCNQACTGRDPRNPIVSCVVDPRSGHELEEPEPPEAGGPGEAAEPGRQADDSGVAPATGPEVLVVGGGPAGLECARVLAGGGRRVRLVEAASALGGTLAAAAIGPGRSRLREATDWLEGELRRLGVEVVLAHRVDPEEVRAARRAGTRVVLATGGRHHNSWTEPPLPVLAPLQALADPSRLPAGPVAVLDPVGDAVAVSLAEWLAVDHGRQVTLVCPDPVAGTLLARTGDLADANARLARAGVERRLRSRVRGITPGGVEVEDRWTGEAGLVAATAVVDCAPRRPDDELYVALGDPTLPRAGDAVAPRSLLEAVLEGRRVALGLLGISGPHLPPGADAPDLAAAGRP